LFALLFFINCLFVILFLLVPYPLIFWRKKLSRTILQLCLILTAFQASRATTITFSQPDGSLWSNGVALPQTCGDSATDPFSGSCSYTVGPEGATPNILLDYGYAPSLSSWTTQELST
jgi:hypothetical protein